MKAERRHELKTNTLALALQRLPELWRQYGTRVLIGLLVVVGGFLVVQQWTQSRRDRARDIQDNLAVARTVVVQIPAIDLWFAQADPQRIASERRQVILEAERAIGIVLREATDPTVRAEALAYRGDLYWHMANLPPLPGADETPELRVHAEHSLEELLDQAERDYLEVVNRYPAESFAAVSARFGLAAVAENRRDWEAAQAHYRQLIDHPNVPELYRQQAEIRLEALDTIRQPVYFATPLEAEFDFQRYLSDLLGAHAVDPDSDPAPQPLPGDPEAPPPGDEPAASGPQDE